MFFSDKFIKATDKQCSFEEYVNAPYFRKEFTLDFVPEKAEITICGLGFYRLWVNGKEITKGALAPYIANCNKILYYDNYRIEEYLVKGKNVIGVLLGNGIRNCFGGFVWGFDKAEYNGPLVLAVGFEAKNATDEIKFEADESFKTHDSPVLFDDLRMGFMYDARLEIEGWNETSFRDEGWRNAIAAKAPTGTPRLCQVEPIKPQEYLSPIKITYFSETPYAFESVLKGAKPLEETLVKDAYLYDFGVNGAGVTSLKIKGEKGQKITIRHAECLQDGYFSLNTVIFGIKKDLYLKYAQTDVYICKGGEEEIFVPSFKYDGFRYALVEGLKKEQATKDALTFIVMNSDLKIRADFECSDATLNALQKMTRRSDLSNFYYFPTDCPHREKNGWTGDISVSAEHILLNMSAEKSFAEWLTNVREVQSSDGILPGIVPDSGWGYDKGPIWDGVCVNVPYYVYKYTGDEQIIKDNAAMMLRYLFGYSRFLNEDGICVQECAIGDWIDPYRRTDGTYRAPQFFTSTTALYDKAKKAAFMFEKVGFKREATYASDMAKTLRESLRKKYINLDKKIAVGECQTSQAVAIEIGLFDKEELPEARLRLLEIVKKDNYATACGMYGLRYIFHALAKAGYINEAYKMITSTKYTCYGAWVKRGATALLENFPQENGKGLCSQNHHFLGDISSFFIQYIAGIKPNPDCNDIKNIEISPSFIDSLDYAKGYYDTVCGRVSAEWRRECEKIVVKVNVPKDVCVRFVIDRGYTAEKEVSLGEGENIIVLSKSVS